MAKAAEAERTQSVVLIGGQPAAGTTGGVAPGHVCSTCIIGLQAAATGGTAVLGVAGLSAGGST